MAFEESEERACDKWSRGWTSVSSLQLQLSDPAERGEGEGE